MFKAYPGFWENIIKKTYELEMGIGKTLGIIFLILLVITIPINMKYRKEKACPQFIDYLIIATFFLGIGSLSAFITGYILKNIESKSITIVVLVIGICILALLIRLYLVEKKSKKNKWLDIEEEARRILFQGTTRQGMSLKSIKVSLFNYPGSVIVEHDYKGENYEITANYRVNELKQEAVLLYKHKGITYLREFGKEEKELNSDENEYLKEFIRNSKNHVSIYIFGIQLDLSILDLLLEKKKDIYYFKDRVHITEVLETEEINYIKELLERDMRFLMTIYRINNIQEFKDKFDLLLTVDDKMQITMEKEGKTKVIELENYYRIKKVMDKYKRYLPKKD